MTANVGQCRPMSANVYECLPMSGNVTQMPANTGQCQPMSANGPMSANVGQITFGQMYVGQVSVGQNVSLPNDVESALVTFSGVNHPLQKLFCDY
jgi:hypothetical protein